MIEEKRREAGAFPTLAGGPVAREELPPVPATHKVLSLTGGTSKQGKGKKKVIVSSFTTLPSASASSTSLAADSAEPEAQRVRPPDGPPKPTQIPEARRPFKNLLSGKSSAYVWPKNAPLDPERKTRRNRKGKDKQTAVTSSEQVGGETVGTEGKENALAGDAK